MRRTVALALLAVLGGCEFFTGRTPTAPPARMCEPVAATNALTTAAGDTVAIVTTVTCPPPSS